MDIWRAAEVLNRRKWLILFSMIVAIVLTFGATRLAGSRWVAAVRFVTPEASSLASVTGTNQAERRTAPTQEEIETLQAMYTAMITSPEVLIPAYKKANEPVPSDADALEDIEFEAIGPRMFELRVYHSDRHRAERIANALADTFVTANHRLITQQSEKVVRLLEEQFKKKDNDLTIAQNRYRTYSSKNRVLGTPEEELRISMSQLETARLNRNTTQQELSATTARLQETEKALAEVLTHLSKPRPVQAGPQVGGLRQELDRVESRLAALQARYGDAHPEVRENLSAREQLTARIKKGQEVEAELATYDEKAAQRTALENTLRELKPRSAELRAQVSELNKMVAETESRILKSKVLGDPLGSLASEVTSLMEERTALLARLNAAQMASDVALRQNPITIMARVNSLNPPVNATAGRTKKLVVLAALCALIGTSALIIALDSIDRRVKTVHQAEQVLPARVLAAIPHPEGALPYAALARISELQPQSLPAESYRFLGLHLLSTAGPEVRSLMALSAKAEQGSTTTITNLAITLAQAGHRVILVDANIRTPELHQVFDVDNRFGFSDLVMDPTASSLERVLLQTSVANLRIITSGSTPENPWELFRSENLLGVSQRLRSMADYVLYDTPSGTLFTDALNLAPIVDAAFLCVRALEAPSGAEQRLLDLVDQAHVRVLGAVLSHVPAPMIAGYENYQHHYAPASLRALSALAAAGNSAAGDLPAAAAAGATAAAAAAAVSHQKSDNSIGTRRNDGFLQEQDAPKEM